MTQLGNEAPTTEATRITFALPLLEGVWASDAKVKGDEVDVTLPNGDVTVGRVVSTAVPSDDHRVMHITMDIDL